MARLCEAESILFINQREIEASSQRHKVLLSPAKGSLWLQFQTRGFISAGILGTEPDFPHSTAKSHNLKSTSVNLSAIGACAAIVIAMLVPSQAWAETQKSAPGDTAAEAASKILDQQLDLSVEEALQMTGE